MNLFHVNADQAEIAMGMLGREFTNGKYNIGYWAWEPEEFPDRWIFPYEEGMVWAEPRLDDAVRQMRMVLGNPELRATRAHKAAEHIRKQLSPEVVGKLMRQRLELVWPVQTAEGTKKAPGWTRLSRR